MIRPIALALILAAGPALAQTELKVAHFMSPKHPMHEHMLAPMAENLKALSGGKLTARIYPAGELGKGPIEQLKRAQTGVADIAFGLIGYTSAQFPGALMIELPGISKGPLDATHMMWRAFDAHTRAEFKGVKVLALWANDTAVLVTRSKPVKSMADVKGMKIRAPSAIAAEYIKAWGAVPVNIPVDGVYQAMDTGVVDGVYIGASGIRSFRLHEVGGHMTMGLPDSVAGFFLVMNEAKWNALAADEKQWLEAATGNKLSLAAAAAYRKDGEEGVTLFKSKKPVHVLEGAGAAEFAKAAEAVVKKSVEELEKKGVPAAKILAAMKGSRS
jgi:TRAP-type C4-dicarboxylate transport system substrate-binding protein